MALRLFSSIILLASAWAGALQFYGNQSYIQWKSAETEHFRFHYPAEFRDEAEQVVSFAEAVHDSVESRYRVKLPGKVDLVIHNSLFSNGQAIPLNNTMHIWLTDWDFDVRSTHRWMNDVVTHEFSHLVSMQSGTKFAPFIHGLQFSWQDYYNEKSQENVSLVYPFLIYPMWLAEGTAQYESARMGFDAWDSHRDMLLRVAVLEDSLLPLEDMWEYAPNGMLSEKGPYNQGLSLVRYITRRFGDQALPNLWSELARVHRVTFTEACRQVLGISEQQLYQDWKAERLDHYTRQRDSLGVLRAGVKRSRNAFWQNRPQVAGGALWGVSNMGSAWFEANLFRMPLPGDSLPSLDSLPKGQRPDSLGTLDLSTFSKNPFHLEKSWLEQGFCVRSLPGQSPRIAYVSYKQRDRVGRAYFDIAVDDTSASPWFGGRPSLRWVTRFADAVQPDLSPDGNTVVFARRERDGARFYLSKAVVPEPGASPEDPVDLVAPFPGTHEFDIYSPKWSPDGRRIAFSFFDGLYRKVAVVDADGKNLRVIADGPWDNRDPTWAPDGKSLVYSSDRTGIYNLYRQSLEEVAHPPTDSSTSPLASALPLPEAMTNVVGGAFSPVVDSTDIWYIGYDKDGFSLYQLALQDSATAKPVGERFQYAPPDINIGDLALQGVERNYRPLPNQPVVVPLIAVEEHADELGSIRHGVPRCLGGVAVGLGDPVGKDFLQLALMLELGKGWDYLNSSGINPEHQSEFYAIGENHSFPVTLGLSYIWRNYPSRDTVRYEDPRSYGDSLTISHYAASVQALGASAGYSVFKHGDSLALGLGIQWANFNLYEDDFSWDYHKQQYLSASFIYQNGAPEDGPDAAGSGDGIALSWMGSRTWLYRPGTFSESFTVSDQGAITPIYRRYMLNEAWFSAWYGVANPIHPGARLLASAQATSILSWSGHSSNTDTLDFFYHHSLGIAGYPVLADEENYLLHGDRTLLGQLHYLFPLYQGLNASWWIFNAKDFYVDVFAQMGTAWWDGCAWRDRFKDRDLWKRSVGFELRFSNTLFMNQPFDVWFQYARALDRVEIDGTQQKVETVSVPLLPSKVEPTGISLGIGMAFDTPWMAARPGVKALR
ncbi:MAG TPA: hypothetical protein VLM37_02835 [Fibrobacteraceae bacterium]|nr:hypothetical protein [Fibrobacteraceae bacterium]